MHARHARPCVCVCVSARAGIPAPYHFRSIGWEIGSRASLAGSLLAELVWVVWTSRDVIFDVKNICIKLRNKI